MKDTYDWWHSDAVDKKRKAAFEADINELHNRQIALLQNGKTILIIDLILLSKNNLQNERSK